MLNGSALAVGLCMSTGSSAETDTYTSVFIQNVFVGSCKLKEKLPLNLSLKSLCRATTTKSIPLTTQQRAQSKILHPES